MNAFDTVPGTEPGTFIAGDFVTWQRADLGVDYPPASYSLSYKARREGSGVTALTIAASADGAAYRVTLSSATTAAYSAGTYHWQAYITRNSDGARLTVGEGVFTVEANRATATTDPRSHVRRVLDAIEAVIENRATRDQESYSIQGRTLARTPIADLLLLRDKYKQDLRAETDAARLAAGLPSKRRIVTRLS